MQISPLTLIFLIKISSQDERMKAGEIVLLFLVSNNVSGRYAIGTTC